MHYLPDWNPTLREFDRALRPGGRLVISTHHPFMDHALAGGSDYFATYDFTETWQRGGRRVQMRFWHRPLSSMTSAIAAAGFQLQIIDEPQPDPVVHSLDPDAWASLTNHPAAIHLLLRHPNRPRANRSARVRRRGQPLKPSPARAIRCATQPAPRPQTDDYDSPTANDPLP
jgi:SAM-dependent methyltransferase